MEGKNGAIKKGSAKIRGKKAEKRIEIIERGRENLRDRTNTRDKRKEREK